MRNGKGSQSALNLCVVDARRLPCARRVEKRRSTGPRSKGFKGLIIVYGDRSGRRRNDHRRISQRWTDYHRESREMLLSFLAGKSRSTEQQRLRESQEKFCKPADPACRNDRAG